METITTALVSPSSSSAYPKVLIDTILIAWRRNTYDRNRRVRSTWPRGNAEGLQRSPHVPDALVRPLVRMRDRAETLRLPSGRIRAVVEGPRSEQQTRIVGA